MSRTVGEMALLVLIGVGSCQVAWCQEASTESTMVRWDRVACMVSEQGANGGEKAFKLASAFFVSTDEGFAIVTAAHAADETNPETKVGFRNEAGTVVGFVLRDVQEAGVAPWIRHPTSDLAMIFVSRDKLPPAVVDVLTRVAHPIDTLAQDEVQRTTKIEIVGFPLGLGAESVSALVMPGSIASRELPVKTTWGQEPIVFALPSVGGGTSGGPVFIANADASHVQIVGMYIGFVADESGSKLSKLVPASVIREFVATTPKP